MLLAILAHFRILKEDTHPKYLLFLQQIIILVIINRHIPSINRFHEQTLTQNRDIQNNGSKTSDQPRQMTADVTTPSFTVVLAQQHRTSVENVTTDCQ